MAVWHSSFDNLPDIAFMFDRSGRILNVNREFRESVTSPSTSAELGFSEVFALDGGVQLGEVIDRCDTGDANRLSVEATILQGDLTGSSIALRCTPVNTGSAAQSPIIATGRIELQTASISGENVGERKFRRLAEAAPVAIYQADPNGHITYVNKQWAQRLGYDQKDLMGTGWQRYVVDAQVYSDDPPWIGFTPANDSRIRTNRFLKSDGEVIEFQTLNQAEFSSDGELRGFVGVMFDVTEQAKALREYEQAEKRFSAFASLSSVGIFRADAKGQLFFANEKWCEIAGVSLEDALGEGWVRAVHPDDRAKVIEAWRSVIDNGEGQARFRFRHSDGSDRHVDVVASAETEVGGRIHGYIGVVVDVTRTEEIAENLSQRERQLALLAENSRDPIFRLDLEGRCLYASPAAEVMLDAKAEGVIGASMLEKCHPEDLAAFLASFQHLASGSRDRSEVTFRAQSPFPPRNYHWMEAQGALVRDGHGNPSEIIVSLRDVTAQRQFESSLQDAREAAERSAKSKASFLANMSHEIRTPMNGVLGYADLLAASKLSGEQREYVDLIRDSGKSMMHLLNDVLDFSKIEARQLSLTKEAVDLPHLLNSTSKLVRPNANQKNLELEIERSDDIPRWIMADRMRLRQILSNLLSNAVKFTESGFIRLKAEKLGSDLQVSVVDSGCGISPERTGTIFESFVQESDTTHQKFGGTGLGLTISKSLAEMMGGSLTVETEPGVGSTFSLRFPLELADSPTDAAPARSEHEPAIEFDGRILVAEDHPVNQALVAAMLAKIGIEFELVSDGGAAFDAAMKANETERPYKLVLMDIEMPTMNGVECTEKLRAEGIDDQSLPIIALTANAFPEDISAYLKAGMQSHLAKPLRLDDLVRELRRWT